MDLPKVYKILLLCRYVPLDIRLPLSKEPLNAMTSNNMMVFFHSSALLRKFSQLHIFSPTQMKRKVPTPVLFQLHVYFNSILIRELRVCKFSQSCVKNECVLRKNESQVNTWFDIFKGWKDWIMSPGHVSITIHYSENKELCNDSTKRIKI